MQKRLAIVLAAGVLVSVSACTGAPFAGSACTPAFARGSASDLVSADGQFGADPKATFPTPL
ncbi:MAG: peptidylprolyl isomerase, partial [Salinibacterium sp.]|nr:peptidylprolyl isomerase [Salinibacterium sp.]